MYAVCVAYILDTGIVPRPQREESSKQKTLEMLPSTWLKGTVKFHMVVVNPLDGVVARPSQHFLGPPTDFQYPLISGFSQA